LILVSRRRGLYQASIPSKIACDSWTFVSYRWVSTTSRCIVDQNDSIIALSTEATRSIEPRSPAWRSRCPNAQEVYCPGCYDRSCPAAVDVANTPSAGHRATKSVRMRSAIDQPTIICEYTSSIAQQCTVPSSGAVFGDVVDPQRVRTVAEEPTLHQVIVERRQRLVATTSATVADTDDTGRAHVRRVGARTARRARPEVRRAPSAPRRSSEKSRVATRYRTRQEAVCGDGFGRSALAR
jgi:hypothetical protein